MKMDSQLVERFRNHLDEQGRSNATVESYGRDVSQFVEFINENVSEENIFDPSTLVEFQEYIKNVREASANTMRRVTISVRQFFRFLADEQHISQSPYDYVVIPEREEGIPEEQDLVKISSIVDQVSQESGSIQSTRNAAIFCLLGIEGLKTSELIELRWSDLFLHEAGQSTLHIAGPRARVMELDPDTAQCLRTYQTAYSRVKHDDPERLKENYVFIAFKGRDASTILPKMTRHGLKFIIYEVGGKHDFDHLNADLLRHHSIYYQLIEIGRAPNDLMNHLGLKRLGLIGKYNRINMNHQNSL